MELGGNGWNQLSTKSNDYLNINSIVNNFKGNNPHRGNLKYDNGYEYISYFTELFKYAVENNKFDSRCYSGKDNYLKALEEIKGKGFSIAKKNGVNDATIDKCKKTYTCYEDSKIHYFGNKYTLNGKYETEITTYSGVSPTILDSIFDSISYSAETETEFIKPYTTSAYSGVTNLMFNEISGNTSSDSEYTIFDDEEYKDFTDDSTIDDTTYGYTEQIVNTKVVDITFNIDDVQNDIEYSNNLIMTKYLDSVIIPYLTQMIPSNTILNVYYKYQNTTS